MKRNYVVAEVDFSKVIRSTVLPDQSLSIQEIVRRYVRGIPADVVQRQGVFLDDDEHDLEKLSRMDFADKAEYARELAERGAQVADEYAAARKEASEAERTEAAAKASAPGADLAPPAKAAIVVP